VVTNRATDQALEAALAGSANWALTYADCDGSVWGRPTISFGGTVGAVGAVTEPTCP
jgi:hypothetical protein